MRYTVILERDPEGMFVAHVPALHGCVSQGETRRETLRNAEEAIALYVETLLEHGQPVPTEAACEAVELTVSAVPPQRRGNGSLGGRGDVHVFPRNGHWAVKKSEAGRALSIHATQRGAMTAAKELAEGRGSEVIVHDRSGAIVERDRGAGRSRATRSSKH